MRKMPAPKRTFPTPNCLEQIARDILDLETLDTRKSDGLDFKEQAVWQIKAALEAAYNLGRESR